MSTTPERLKTYINWTGRPSVEDLARAGFVYSGPGDKVKCESCNLNVEDWEPDDKPFEEHECLSSSCPFVREVLKVCKDQHKDCDDVLCADEVKCCGDYPVCSGITQMDAIPTKMPQADDLKDVPSMEDMDLNDEGQRRATFKGWPHEKPLVDEMVQAGFCYTGKRDIVMCFVCKGYVHDWKAEDDPIMEHSTLYKSQCSLVKQLTNEEETSQVIGAVVKIHP